MVLNASCLVGLARLDISLYAGYALKEFILGRSCTGTYMTDSIL